jgi:hypothetical protein
MDMTRALGSRRLLRAALAALVIASASLPFKPAAASQAPPEKSVILAGWHGPVTPTPQFIQDHFQFLESRPFNGMVVYVSDPAFATNVTAGVMHNVAMSYEDMSAVLDPIRNLPFSQLRDNFAYVFGNTPPDFFDDWTVPVQNFRNLARALKDAGLRGIFFDNEPYITGWGWYPDGVAYPEIPIEEYEAQASLRGREVMEAMIEEYPEIVVITLHGPYISDPWSIQQMGFPDVFPYYDLLGPFFTGFLQGAGSPGRSVDGGELYWFREHQDFADSYDLRKTGIASDAANCPFIPPSFRPSWPGLTSISFGLLDRPFMGEDMTPAILATTLMNALERSDRWVWLYTEDRTFLTPESEGGAAQVWVDAVRVALPVEIVPVPPASKEERSSCGLLGMEAVVILFAFRWIRSRRSRPA